MQFLERKLDGKAVEVDVVSRDRYKRLVTRNLHRLENIIHCLNSVDTSTMLEIGVSWLRLVCANGMMFGLQDSRLRRRHVQSLDPEDIAAYLKGQLDHLPQEKSLHAEWLNTGVEASSLIGWLERDVAKEWGPHAAARVWNIINVGYDGPRGTRQELQAPSNCQSATRMPCRERVRR